MELRIDEKDDVSLSSYGDDPESSTGESEPKPFGGQSSPDELHYAQKETKRVKWSKILVYVVLAGSAAATAALAYMYTAAAQTEQFEARFKTYADELHIISNEDLQDKMDVGEILAKEMTSFAMVRNETWPFVTLPDFERRNEKPMHISEATLISFQTLVRPGEEQQWGQYSMNNSGWIREALLFEGSKDSTYNTIPSIIHDKDGNKVMAGSSAYPGKRATAEEQTVENFMNSISLPVWQTYKAPDSRTVNLDLLHYSQYRSVVEEVMLAQGSSFSFLLTDDFVNMIAGRNIANSTGPFCFILIPVRKNFFLEVSSDNMAGYLLILVPWMTFFHRILPFGVAGIDVVIGSTCSDTGSYTLRVEGPDVIAVGAGDLHDRNFDYLGRTPYSWERLANQTLFHNGERCELLFNTYPTVMLQDEFVTNEPLMYALVVVSVFAFTALIFISYDFVVQRRQTKVMTTAKQTQAIVSHLFPKQIQDRILADAEREAEAQNERDKNKRRNMYRKSNADQLHTFLRGGKDDFMTPGKSRPLADLFPEATVIFADIVGFTAWSSTREPAQVFMLLETIYKAFDEIAARRKVFKVETVGDCYVAVVGLPDPRRDHAVVMTRFARDCLFRFNSLTRDLVLELGPDTEELDIRIGIHSGPVTAGVLRGERARFQLFGDTVNIASKMEHTGRPNMIQASQETANLLRAAGKKNWLTLRSETVSTGLDELMQTYWVDGGLASSGKSNTSDLNSSEPYVAEPGEQPAAILAEVAAAPEEMEMDKNDKHERLVAWNCDILSKLLSQVIAHRLSHDVTPDPVEKIRELEKEFGEKHLIMSEVTEIMKLPKETTPGTAVDPYSIELSETLLKQLNEYVSSLATMYRNNPFHNFEHASHVTMSVMKLLSRIVAPELDESETLHDHTYGITSDPLTQFAVVLSALMHDADHPGVPNSQLVREQSRLAVAYQLKSIAEQNSVDLAWELLMDEKFEELRRTIYATEVEFRRFRQMVVNTVMATDIMDKDLGKLRKERWDKAFADEGDADPDSVDRKASIVIEHLIAASDVAHTMQHWHVYQKWNKRFFHECYNAYLSGRSEKNPADTWFEGEKGFFDFYIVPLARKLKNCGVFGVSSDEYLQFALSNRKEWESKGQEIVASMLEAIHSRPAPAAQPKVNGDNSDRTATTSVGSSSKKG